MGNMTGVRKNWKDVFSSIPLLAWLLGALAAALLEHLAGEGLSEWLGLDRIPVLFGFVVMLKDPIRIPGVLGYVLLIYAFPMIITAKLTAPPANRFTSFMLRLPLAFSTVLHLAVLFAALHFWSDISAYRVLTLKLTLIAVMVTLSLNVINGYMGEFSCSHPGFMALGAYGASVFTLVFFAKDRVFGLPLLPPELGPFLFPIALIAGGLLAAVCALLVAVPSFRTRGDYLAIISLAFMFIVKSALENLEVVGGSRGLGSQPGYASLPVVFVWAVLCVWIINNFVRSTLGKALNAVRDDESAAEAMTINTRKVKMTAFLFGAFWAGVAGGLFAHVLRYVNPSTFGIQKLAEVLAMVYFGGLNSVFGSILGAVSLNLLGEALRPLEIYKWIIIPLLLILVMIYRPAGLIAFREFDVRALVSPRGKKEKTV